MLTMPRQQQDHTKQVLSAFARKNAHRDEIYARRIIELMKIGYQRALLTDKKEVHILLPPLLFMPGKALNLIYGNEIMPIARRMGVTIQIHAGIDDSPEGIEKRKRLSGIVLRAKWGE